MRPAKPPHGLPIDYELRFASLFHEGHALSFPRERAGCVRLDDMSERARANYFFARSVVGRDFAMPAICPAPAY